MNGLTEGGADGDEIMIGKVRVTSYYETYCDACRAPLRASRDARHYEDAEAEWKAAGWRRAGAFGWLCPKCAGPGAPAEGASRDEQ